MFYCSGCNKEVLRDDADFRTEDNTFSAPFGAFHVVVGGSIDKIEICPHCGEDLEEVVE